VIVARRIIDLAIGALMELRGCSEGEAARELVLAGGETALGTEGIARALVNVVGGGRGDVADPEGVAAVGRWRHLLGARVELDPARQDYFAGVANDIMIRYGGVNDDIRC